MRERNWLAGTKPETLQPLTLDVSHRLPAQTNRVPPRDVNLSESLYLSVP